VLLLENGCCRAAQTGTGWNAQARYRHLLRWRTRPRMRLSGNILPPYRRTPQFDLNGWGSARRYRAGSSTGRRRGERRGQRLDPRLKFPPVSEDTELSSNGATAIRHLALVEIPQQARPWVTRNVRAGGRAHSPQAFRRQPIDYDGRFGVIPRRCPGPFRASP